MKFLDRVFGERTARARGLAEHARELLAKGQNERAQDALVKALRLDPDSPEARELYAGCLSRRGLVRWTDGDLGGAVAEFTRSLKVVQNPIVIFYRGLVHKEAREHLKAIEDLSKVVRTEDPRSIPYLVWALAARGECYQEMGELKGALKDFQVCIEQRAGGPCAYRYLFKCAGIEKQLGNAARAGELVARVLEMRPGFKPAEVLRVALGQGAKNQEKIHHRDTETQSKREEEQAGKKREVGAEGIVAAPRSVPLPAQTAPSASKPFPARAAVVTLAPAQAVDRVAESVPTVGAHSGRRLAAEKEAVIEARGTRRAASQAGEGRKSEQVSFWERNTIPRPEPRANHGRKEVSAAGNVVAPAAPVLATTEVRADASPKAPPVLASTIVATAAAAPVVVPSAVVESPTPTRVAATAPVRVEDKLLGRVEALLRGFDRQGGPALDESIDFLLLTEKLRERVVHTNGHSEAVRVAEERAREVIIANALVPFVRELSDEAGTLLTRTDDEILHDRVARHRAKVLVLRFEKLTRAERFLFYESCGAERFTRFSSLVGLAATGRLA